MYFNWQPVVSGAFWLEILESRWYRQGYHYFCTIRLCDRGIEACAGILAYLDPRLGMVMEYDRIENMSKNYALIFLKNTGAIAKWVAPTPPPTKRVALTLPHLISEYYYILI